MSVVLLNTPLCPAGHLPHKGGDRIAATSRPNLTSAEKGSRCAQPISLLVGEMPGRVEGGTTRTLQKTPNAQKPTKMSEGLQ